MRIQTPLPLIAILATLAAHTAFADVIINEFMASNGTTIADENDDYEDWIELLNTGTAPVDIGGWGLSDNPDSPFKWTFANGTLIAPGEFLLVWASGKDRPGQNISPPGQSTPDEIPGLVTWLRADTAPFNHGDPVQTWQDTSGLGNDATQPTVSQRPTFTQNAINGLPALSFTRSANQQLFLPTATFNGMDDLSNFTFVSVAQWTGGTISGLFGGYRGSNLTNSGSTVFEINNVGGNLRLRVPTGINTTASAAVTQNQWHILGCSTDSATSRGRVFVDGITVTEQTGTLGTTFLANYDRVPIGSSHDANRTFGGQIAEVMIYNRPLSPLEHESLNAYLALKYSLVIEAVPIPLFPHTNFSISSSGEPLLLTRPDGTTADEVSPIELPRDISYGRTLADPTVWTLLQTATPGTPNDSPAWLPPPDPVAFSHAPGVHTSPFALTLDHPDSQAVIIYSLDGSEPNIENLGGTTYQFRASYNSGPLIPQTFTSLEYSGTIPVSDRSPEPNKISLITTTADSNPNYLPVDPVKKATVVRARAYVNGVPGPVTSATYFISDSGAFDYPIPIISLLADEDGLFDYHQGIYVAGVDRVTSTGGRICGWANHNRRGIDAERLADFQFYENGTLALDRTLGIRIHGNCSRQRPFKSMRLHARNSYDPRGDIDFPFFDTQFPDATVPDNTTFRRLILRQPNINEVSFCRLFQPVYGGVGGRLRPAVKFINGEYWGISFLRDRLDHHHLAFHYDLDPDNITQINIKYGHEVGSSALRVFDLDHGIPADMDDFWAMRNFIIGNNMAVSANYNQAVAMLDVDSFIDHLILKIFSGDDHYAPEYVFWRAREPQDNGFGDGRWRVIVKDFDSTLHTDNYVFGLANGTHPRPFGFELFQSLLDNTSFQNRFINRFADLLNAHFQPERFQQIINDSFDEMQPVWAEFAARWNNVAIGNPHRPFTTTHRNNLINWSNQHPPRQRNHIRNHFGIASSVDLTVDVSDPAHGHIRVNTIDITADTPGIPTDPYPWTGTYFLNIPVTLTAVPASGFRVAGWRENAQSALISTSPQFTAPLNTASTYEAVFEPISIIHQWDFENATTFLEPSQTVGGDAGITVEPGPATEILRNAAAQDFDTAHLRANNPIGATLIWALPTIGFGELTLSWETRRSGQGAGTQNIEFTTNGENWLPLDSYHVFDSAPQQKSFDLTGLDTVENNPHFAIRVTFAQGDGGGSGNNRFDNVTLTGIPLPGGLPPATITFDAAPTGTASGSPLTPIVVRLLDENGNPATTFNGPVTLTLVGNGSLSGSNTVNATFGTAIFENLTLTGTGTFQFIANAAGLDPATTPTFQSLSLTSIILPQYIQGEQDANNANNDRVPFAWQARIDGLAPLATYRIGNRVTLPTDASDNNGAGNAILITSPTENWVRNTNSPRFRPTDLNSRHIEITADADGSYTGWFITEPTGNARFTPGNDLHMRLLLNDGNGGEDTTHILTTTESAQVLRFGTSTNEGTAIIGQSSTAARRIVVLHDETTGTSRPLAATPVEITGSETDSRYAAFYQTIVATNQSHWGTIIPNDLSTGLQRIDVHPATGDGPILDTRLAPAGFPGTLDPSGGLTTPILLDSDAGLPIFLPGGNATWHTPANWSTASIPNAPAAQAIINPPATGNRNVNINSPATIGSLRVNQAATNHRNRIRDNNPAGTLTFNGGGQPALLRVEGAGGTGHVDLDFDNPVTLATTLNLLVNQADGGDPQQGALRLQQTWNGPGGITKQGPGLASLTGEGKDFTGPLIIEQGALRITGPAVPANTTAVTILPGGQLRLVSTGTPEEPRIHTFGGGAIHIGGMGRGGDLPPSEQLGVLGALRYDPDSQDNLATLTNPLNLTATTDIHIDGTRNTLRLDGEINANTHALIKTGGGTLHLATDSPDAPPVTVETGTLTITAAYPASIHLTSGTTLTGNGTITTITGPGTVDPGDQQLTATTSAATNYAFLFTETTNGILSLTALTEAPAQIDIHLDVASLLPGTTFQGGLLLPAAYTLPESTTLNLLIAEEEAPLTYRDQTYRVATESDNLTWSIVETPAGHLIQVTVATGYTLWSETHFTPAELADETISGPTADPTNSGTPNLLRYALCLTPTENPNPRLPRLTDNLTYRFPIDLEKTDITYRVLTSPDLSDWSQILYDSTHPSAPTPTEGWLEIPILNITPRSFFRLEIELASNP